MNISDISVIIPAYRPNELLLSAIKGLVGTGFSDIIVVDDGSGEAFAPVFEEVKGFSQCTVLRHPVNRGKGAALRTAMDYFLRNREAKLCAVTADADGQHLAEDIKAVALKAADSGKIVLGTRDFSKPDVPARSRMGNRITSVVFLLFFGMKIRDTQTGLRAFPRQYMAELLKVEGDRYEYETNMLFFINRQKLPFEQVDITTVYIDENNSSHFRVVRDSIRIYALILKYLFSSTAAAVIDELAFYIFKKIAVFSFLPIPLTFTAAFLARVVSSFINFLMNAKLVFGEAAGKKALIKYYILAVMQISVSSALVFGAEHVLDISSPALSALTKAVIDTVLFFFSFRIQHKWVFNNGNENKR